MKPHLSKHLHTALLLCFASFSAVTYAETESGDTTPANLTWKGTKENHTWNTVQQNTIWSSGDSEETFFKSGDNVTFGSGYYSKVVIGEEIQVGTMLVNDKYTFDVQKDATIKKVQVSAGKAFEATGSGTLSVGTLTGSGGCTITLYTDTKITNNEGNGEGSNPRTYGLSVTGPDQDNTINIKGGTTTVSGATFVSRGTLLVDTGAKLVTTRLEMGVAARDGSTSTLQVNGGGTIVVTSVNDISTDSMLTGLVLSEFKARTTAYISGTLLAKDVCLYNGYNSFTLNIKSGGTVAVKGISQYTGTGNYNGGNTNGTITLEKGGKLVLGRGGITAQNRTWSTHLNGGEVGMSADTTIAQGATLGGEVAFNTAKYVFDGEGADQKLTAGTVGGTMTVSGVLSGTGSVKKTGDGTLVLSGENTYSGGTTVAEGVLQVQKNGNLGGGNVTISGGALEVSTTDGTSPAPVSMTALKGAGKGKMENVAFNSNSLSARPASGEGASGTGKMKSLSVQFAVNLDVLDLSLEDVCFTAAPTTASKMTYTNTKALACLATPAGTQQQNGGVSVMAENSGNTPAATHTLTTVQTGGTAVGGLTIDFTSGFYAGNAGTTLEWTVFNGVILDSGFTLAFGDVLKSFIREGKVTLSGSLVGPDDWKLTSEDVENPLSVGTGGLLSGTTDTPALLADTGTGDLITGGTLVLRVTNSPEPATATLSLLALAAFAARRRRKRA